MKLRMIKFLVALYSSRIVELMSYVQGTWPGMDSVYEEIYQCIQFSNLLKGNHDPFLQPKLHMFN
jgi:hypothetical protein